MNGLMMDVPLTITSIMRHAECVHGHKEIVSITRDNLATATRIASVSLVPPTGQRHAGLGARAGRSRRHAGLERLPPYGDVLRLGVLWLCVPYHQPATVHRANRLHHQSC